MGASSRSEQRLEWTDLYNEYVALFDEKLFHGEAVSIDMALSACLAHARKAIDGDQPAQPADTASAEKDKAAS